VSLFINVFADGTILLESSLLGDFPIPDELGKEDLAVRGPSSPTTTFRVNLAASSFDSASTWTDNTDACDWRSNAVVMRAMLSTIAVNAAKLAMDWLLPVSNATSTFWLTVYTLIWTDGMVYNGKG